MAVEGRGHLSNQSSRSSSSHGSLNNGDEARVGSTTGIGQHQSGRGILSQTLVQSPSIHAILPGKIRSKQQNDVIFIGEDFIQILELGKDGYLKEVATKADFNSSILTAKVISFANSEADDFIDAVVKQERDSYGDEMDWSEEEKVEPPPQLLVLALRSKEILFLYGSNRKDGHVDFHISTHILPIEVSSLYQYGELLAVDSKSRAIAVGTSFGRFCIMALNPSNEIKAEHSKGNQLPAIMPVVEVSCAHLERSPFGSSQSLRNDVLGSTGLSCIWTFYYRPPTSQNQLCSYYWFRRVVPPILCSTSGTRCLA